MQTLCSPILLIGFKHVGKSVIGKNLAHQLHLPFIDLDQKIEFIYESKFGKKYTCRQIMQEHGEKSFRLLEINALSQVVNFQPSIVSLGGGAPLCEENQKIIKSCIPVHITASRNIVFERIFMGGQPAFLNAEEGFLEFFNKLWDEREEVYRKITNFLVENNGSIDEAVSKIISKLREVSK